MGILFDPILRWLHNILPWPASALVPDPDGHGSGRPDPSGFSFKEDELSRLIAGSRRTTLAPTEEFELMPSAQRRSNLNYLYEIVTDALRGSNPRAEADILHIASSRDPMSGVARRFQENFVILFEMHHTEDPAEFGRQTLVYFDRVMEKIARLLEEGPESFRKVVNYVREIKYGPNKYILSMFHNRFKERLDEGDSQVRSIKHDITRIEDIKLFENEAGLRKVWTAERIRELFDMHMLAQLSNKVYARSVKTALRHVLLGAMRGVGVEVEIDRYLRYRDGLELTEVDLILHELIHNGIKYHVLERGKEPHVIVKWDGERYALIVEDNGRGVYRRDKVFEFGFREADRNPGVSGTGTGLAAVKDRIEKLGWRIELESEPEKGSTFIIHPRPGDIISEDTNGSGGAQGGGGAGGPTASKSDFSSYKAPHEVSGLLSSGEAGAHVFTAFRYAPAAVATRRSVFAIPVWAARFAPNVAAATFVRTI